MMTDSGNDMDVFHVPWGRGREWQSLRNIFESFGYIFFVAFFYNAYIQRSVAPGLFHVSL